jgi:hypothetical protein
MPLQDHFHPPLSLRRHWHAFHNAWATYLSSELNRRLPPGYFAEPNVQFNIRIDVAAFEETGAGAGDPGAWTPPAPPVSVAFTLATDIVEVLIYSSEGGPTLAAAIELVSPANKDRAVHRDAFVSKCAAYVQQGVGLVILDVVTDRGGNLHEELLTRLRATPAVPLSADLYAVAYQPVSHDEDGRLNIWPQALAVGQPLPTLPLYLRGGPCVPIELEAVYERTRHELRVGVNGA